MMLAGAVGAAPASPGATRPTAAVTPTRRPVARARRRAEAERRPGGAAAEERSRDGAIRDLGVDWDTGELPSLDSALGEAGTGIRARRACAPAAPAGPLRGARKRWPGP